MGRFSQQFFDGAIHAPADFDGRIEWAGERLWDIAEGVLDRDDASFVIALVYGWGDYCEANEHRAYREMARRLADVSADVFDPGGTWTVSKT
jgi:hypothetical protein